MGRGDSAPLLARFLGAYLRSGLRGSTRSTVWLADHVPSLREVPIVVNRSQRLFVNLQDGLSHVLLAGSPLSGAPWEEDEQEVMRALVRPGDVAFDIGAHIGLHTVLLSELAGASGAVHAFEPNPAKLPPLRRTAAELPNVVVHGFAIGDAAASAPLFVPGDQSMASLTDWTAGRVGAVSVSTCDVRRLDDLIAAGELPRPDFIKCDIEGAELSAWKGAQQTLARPDAPILLYEANVWSAAGFGLTIDAATAFLLQLEGPAYQLFQIQPPGRMVPFEKFDAGCDNYNLVAVPWQRRDQVRSHSQHI